MKPQVSPDVTDLEVKPDAPPPKPRIRHRQWGGTATGLLAGIGILALGRAGHLWASFDVAAQFGAQALCIVTGFAVAAFLPRYKALFGIALAGLCALAYSAWPVVTSQTVNKGPFSLQPGETAARFVQFNVHSNNKDAEAVANELRRLDADVVTMEETEGTKREVLFRLRTDYPYQYDCSEVPGCEFAVVSRVPLTAGTGVQAWDAPPFVKVSLGGRLTGVTVFAVHLLRFPYSRLQLQQVGKLVKRLEQDTGHIILMGDFNATPFSRVPMVIEQATGMKRLTYVPSWPAWLPLPQLAIDHVFASPGIRALAPPQIGNASGSDHFPVVINLAIPQQ